MARTTAADPSPPQPRLRALRLFVPLTSEDHGSASFMKDGLKWFATPMLAVLIAIETTDILFPADSIPTVTEPFSGVHLERWAYGPSTWCWPR